MKQEQIKLDLGEDKQLNMYGGMESIYDTSTTTTNNKIDYNDLIYNLKKDNMYSEELEKWLDNYMKYNNK